MDEFFPILRHPEFKLPWRVIAPHEAQAQRNHYQTLEQLARRGGLSFVEAFCVLTDTHWSGVAHTEANERRAKERIEGMVRTYQHPYGVNPSRGAWVPDPLEDIGHCLDNSLKRAAELLRSTGHAGDAIDAQRIEYQRKLNTAGVKGPDHG